MERDLRDTPLYREIEEHFRRMHEPAFGRISWATDVAPSPDGRSIAFTGSVLRKLEGLPATRIGLTDAHTGEVRQVTAGPNSDRLPRWSPDGSRLAFLSDRAEEGRFQLHLLDSAQLGEAVAVTAVEGSVEYHHWSPDGTSILLGVAGTGADLAGVQGSGTTKQEKVDLPSWMPSVHSSDAERGWRRAWVLDVASGELRPASREGLNVWEAVWCGPDRLAAIVSEGPGEETWYRAPLAMIDVESGKEQVLVRSDVQLGLPAASPSGRRLAVVEALCSDRLVVAGDIRMVDPGSGDTTPVDARGTDVTHLAWRDDDRLVFSGVRGQDTVCGELNMSAGTVTELWVSAETNGYIYPEAQPTGDAGVAIVRQSYERYAEIAVIASGRAGAVASLSHPGSDYLRTVAGTMEMVTWTAPDGLDINGLLVRPAGDGPHALVVVVHGGPISVVQSRWPTGGLTAFLVGRGYAVLFPNPRGSTGRGQEFATMVYGDAGGGDAADILAGIDALVERGVADNGRIGVTGGSYGGFMSAWLVTQTDRFAAAVAVSPVTDWYSQHYTSNIGFWDHEFLKDSLDKPGGEYFARSPIMFAGRARTPTLVTAGAVDECTPPGQGVEFHRALLEAGVETDLALYPEEGHGVRRFPAAIDYCTRAVGWFERHMPARPSGASG